MSTKTVATLALLFLLNEPGHARTGGLAANGYQLAPTVDLGLNAVRAHVAEKFAFLGDDLVFALPPGFEIRVFAARGLAGPRLMAWSPSGVLHVANMKVGSPNQWAPASDKSSGQIVALPDLDHDGVADSYKIVADGFWWVHSLAFYRGDLYVADTDKIYRMADGDGDGFYETRQVFVDDLPTFNNRGGSNHVTKAIVFDEAKDRFFVNVGSSCDLCREGNPERASVLVFNTDGSGRRVYARGLRNAAGIDLHPITGELWATHNGHDREGGELPPEWISPIREEGFYGWPFGFANRIFVDFGIYNGMLPLSAADSLSVTGMDVPAALIPAHLAPIGIHFYDRDLFPSTYRNAAFAALRGGQTGGNLATVPGFKVIAIFSEPDGSGAQVADFLTGFGPGRVRKNLWGKPVGLTTDARGNLYVSSDHTNSVILRVGLATLFGQWQDMPPDTLIGGREVDLTARVILRRFEDDGALPELVADLSALGGSRSSALTRVGDGSWELSARVPLDAGNGRKQLRVTISQTTAAGVAEMVLPASIVILPGTDLVVLDDILDPTWQGHGILGAGKLDFSATGPVFQGQRAAAVTVKPLSNTLGWKLTFIADEVVPSEGFRSLRFAFHPGDVRGTSLQLLVATLNNGRYTHRMDLLAGPLDLQRSEWQLVDLPLTDMVLDGPIERISLTGNLAGTFYLDRFSLTAERQMLTTAIAQADYLGRPRHFILAQNYPNPFNGDTVVRFILPAAATVDLVVYNSAGQRVATLMEGARAYGHHQVRWDGRDTDGNRLASGVYFYRLRAADQVQVRKLILLR